MVQLLSPDELALPFTDHVELEDPESGARRLVDAAVARRAYEPRCATSWSAAGRTRRAMESTTRSFARIRLRPPRCVTTYQARRAAESPSGAENGGEMIWLNPWAWLGSPGCAAGADSPAGPRARAGAPVSDAPFSRRVALAADAAVAHSRPVASRGPSCDRRAGGIGAGAATPPDGGSQADARSRTRARGHRRHLREHVPARNERYADRLSSSEREAARGRSADEHCHPIK